MYTQIAPGIKNIPIWLTLSPTLKSIREPKDNRLSLWTSSIDRPPRDHIPKESKLEITPIPRMRPTNTSSVNNEDGLLVLSLSITIVYCRSIASFVLFLVQRNLMKTKLSVNINKVALIRNSRGSNLPNIVQFAMDCESMGADGITVHPRPDQRHIRYDDIPQLKEVVTTELNIEGYPSPDFMRLVLDNEPDQCTLVPDPPGVLTSSEGWKIDQRESFLKDVIKELQSKNIRVSLFVDPIVSQIEMAHKVGADRVELYTGGYAHQYEENKISAVKPHIDCSQRAAELGIGLNAGHDLDLNNLRYYGQQLIGLQEVSIGHALISDALYYGISNVIGMYKALLG